jgi:tetratricopeptide (TPR) repeat protein
MIALKIYGKVLLKLGEKDQAIAIIEQALAGIDQYERSNLAAKFNILLGLARQDRRPAERVLHNQKVEKRIRLLAYRFLQEHCVSTGDEAALMKYSKLAEEYSLKLYDILDEEAL